MNVNLQRNYKIVMTFPMHYVNTSILQGRQTTYDTFSTPIFKGHSFYQISNQFLFDFKIKLTTVEYNWTTKNLIYI